MPAAGDIINITDFAFGFAKDLAPGVIAASFTLNSAIVRAMTFGDGSQLINFKLDVTYTGSTITPSGTANITDTSCFTLNAAYRPTETVNTCFGTSVGTGEVQLGTDGNTLLRSYDAGLSNPTTVRMVFNFLKD